MDDDIEVAAIPGGAGLSVGLDSLRGMAEPWGVERVLALASDPNVAAAGAALAGSENWVGAGCRVQPLALWGVCRGSGKKPYQTVADLGVVGKPAFTCSCPSRKFPCKHALGLLLRWAEGGVPAGEPVPEFAGSWLEGRVAAAGVGTARAPRAAPADPQAAAKRAADRLARVTAGLEELDQWLCDQIRTGLAGSGPGVAGGGRQFEAIAARMVDSQAPAVASRLRQLDRVRGSGEGWHGRLLERFAQLRLLIQAHRRLPELPDQLAAVVRAHVGYPVAGADVLAGRPVRDTWSVLGLREQEEERLTSRRIWLQGEQTRRPALLLSYALAGQSFEASLLPGTRVDADLHFYPGGNRALVGARHGEAGPLGQPGAVGIAEALGGYAAALAADPWTPSWPFLLADVVPVREAERWLLRQDDGAALPIAAAVGAPWVLVSCSGGGPVTVLGEWSAEGFTPVSVIRRRRLVRL